MVTTVLVLGSFVAVGIAVMVATATFVFTPDLKNSAERSASADDASLLPQRVA